VTFSSYLIGAILHFFVLKILSQKMCVHLGFFLLTPRGGSMFELFADKAAVNGQGQIFVSVSMSAKFYFLLKRFPK